MNQQMQRIVDCYTDEYGAYAQHDSTNRRSDHMQHRHAGNPSYRYREQDKTYVSSARESISQQQDDQDSRERYTKERIGLDPSRIAYGNNRCSGPAYIQFRERCGYCFRRILQRIHKGCILLGLRSAVGRSKEGLVFRRS